LALAIALLAGCGGEEPRHLTVDDVTVLPGGTATGTSFSGTYFADRVDIQACNCHRGPCSMINGMTGTTTVTQNGGAVTILSVNPPPLIGGIDLDGRFSAGASAVFDTLYDLVLMEGTLRAQRSIDATVTTTAVGSVGAVQYDCDIHAQLHASYTGP
jgi:hypothetical protein